MECKKCEKTIDDYRYHLGYTECVECSEVEKYSHTKYILTRQVVMYNQ